eukprot:UN08678
MTYEFFERCLVKDD